MIKGLKKLSSYLPKIIDVKKISRHYHSQLGFFFFSIIQVHLLPAYF